MSYEQFIKYLPKDKKITREEYDTRIGKLKSLEALDLPIPIMATGTVVPPAVIFLAIEKEQEEARHREIVELLSQREPYSSPAAIEPDNKINAQIRELFRQGKTDEQIGWKVGLGNSRVKQRRLDMRLKRR